jgi:muramoyltetrapeptide carboxypeptidase
MSRTAEKNLFRPLTQGDTIGLFAPSGPISEENFRAGLRILEDMGFNVKYRRDILRRQAYLAGSDEERAGELSELWCDPEIKALLAVRGGYGALRLLPLLDMELFRAIRKPLIGFSDITILHAALHRHSGLCTFHGPMLSTLPKCDRPSQEAFFNMLTGHAPEHIKPKGLEILRHGSAQGILRGGNLTNLTHLVGTDYEDTLADSILLLEDVGEAPYRIDRLLTHLHSAGRLSQLAGIILGDFIDCGDVELVWNRVLELLAGSTIPIWGNFPAGHGNRNEILPLGVEVEMDSSHGRLVIAEQILR